jgi:hypothetical protein
MLLVLMTVLMTLTNNPHPKAREKPLVHLPPATNFHTVYHSLVP